MTTSSSIHQLAILEARMQAGRKATRPCFDNFLKQARKGPCWLRASMRFVFWMEEREGWIGSWHTESTQEMKTVNSGVTFFCVLCCRVRGCRFVWSIIVYSVLGLTSSPLGPLWLSAKRENQWQASGRCAALCCAAGVSFDQVPRVVAPAVPTHKSLPPGWPNSAQGSLSRP